MPSEPPPDRCGYVNDSGWGKYLTCWREVWANDRCLWHADVEGKPLEQLNASLAALDAASKTTREWERFDGAVLRGIVLDDSLSFENLHFPDADFRSIEPPWGDYPELERPWATRVDEEIEIAQFVGADLKGADLSGGNFPHADFTDADLDGATFEATGLAFATFDGTTLRGADFSGAFLGGATFSDNVQAPESTFTNARLLAADLEGIYAERAIFDQADLSGATLDGAELYAGVLSDIRLVEATTFGDHCVYDEESDTFPPEGSTDSVVRDFDTENPQKAMWMYRQLETIHEANGMSDRARAYHVRKEEEERRDHRDNGRYGAFAVATINQALSGHGESLRQVLLASAAIIVGSGIAYPFIGGIVDGGTHYGIGALTQLASLAGIEAVARGLYFSIITFTTIGYAETAPVGPYSRLLVGVESLLGAIMIAMFVYVLGRRVAR